MLDARSRRGLTQTQLGWEALKRNEAKGFVSQIEHGKRQITPRTAGKLATFLDLPESALDPFLGQPDTGEDEVTPQDRDAERLIRLIEQDPAVPPAAEALLVSLAYEFAQGTHGELITAHNGLRAALQAAADIKARGQLPQNVDDQLQAVMQRLAELNDRGQREEAADALDDAMERVAAERERVDAEREAVFRLQLDQDRVLNRPETAAKRLVANLRASAPPGGVFRAMRKLLREWLDRGETQGSPFDLHVALHLARINCDRANGPHKLEALGDLGASHTSLGQRSAGDLNLTKSVRILSEVVKRARGADPQLRAAVQGSLGIALLTLGEREQDAARLNQAIGAFRTALRLVTPETTPKSRSIRLNNLGNALSALGERGEDPAPCARRSTPIGKHSKSARERPRR